MPKRPRKSDYKNGHGSSSSADPHSFDDDCFDYSGPTSWKPKKSTELNSTFVVVEPIQKVDGDEPRQLDYEMKSTKVIKFGAMSRFLVTGAFMRKKATIPADAANNVDEQTFDWESIPAADAARVYVQPGWLDFLIKEINVYHNLQKIKTSEENRAITPHINRWMDAYQDKEVLKLSAPQAYHPNRHIAPLRENSLTIDSQEWQDYAKTIFHENELTIDYYPRIWPFVQHVNHLHKHACKALPMPLFQKLVVRMTFVDDMKCIFKKAAGNTDDYKFQFENVQLILEEAKLDYHKERALFSSKKLMSFPGLARITKVETFNPTSPTYKTHYTDVVLPDCLIVFAIEKKAANDQYKWSLDTEKNKYLKHNIKEVEITFNHQSFSVKQPSPSNYEYDDLFTNQTLHNHLKHPLFGLVPDKKKFDIELFAEGGNKSSYPAFIFPFSLFNGDSATRKVPALDDGSCLSKRSTLDLLVRFDNGGSTDAAYVFVIYWNDHNLVYDPKNHIFFSPYGIQL